MPHSQLSSSAVWFHCSGKLADAWKVCIFRFGFWSLIFTLQCRLMAWTVWTNFVDVRDWKALEGKNKRGIKAWILVIFYLNFLPFFCSKKLISWFGIMMMHCPQSYSGVSSCIMIQVLSSFFLFQRFNLLVWYRDDILSLILFWDFILYNGSRPLYFVCGFLSIYSKQLK